MFAWICVKPKNYHCEIVVKEKQFDPTSLSFSQNIYLRVFCNLQNVVKNAEKRFLHLQSMLQGMASLIWS